MKLFFTIAMVTSTVLLLVQGAPQITSEQLGRAVEELQEMIKSELQAAEAKSAYANSQQWGGPYANSQQWGGPYAKSEWGYPRQGELNTEIQQIREQLKATAQVSGLQINNCGLPGTIISAALGIINIYRSEFGVLVDCKSSADCVTVQVDVPANNLISKVNVCNRPNKPACVEVEVRATKQCKNPFGIPIQIPLPNGDQITVSVRVDIPSPGLPPIIPATTACVNVDVSAPKC